MLCGCMCTIEWFVIKITRFISLLLKISLNLIVGLFKFSPLWIGKIRWGGGRGSEWQQFYAGRISVMELKHYKMRFVCERKSELNVTVCCCVYLAPRPIMSVDRANKYCRGVHSTEFSVQICTLASYISLSMDCNLVERVWGLLIGTYIYMFTMWLVKRVSMVGRNSL